jgi:MFS family permease
MFRNLLIADVVSDVGTFMQGVGATWLMVSLGAGPLFVALTQTASSLPFFILALPAGAIGDIVDRRKLILFTEAWMACVALTLTIVTVSGLMSPWLLLGLTFALSAGDAIETPTWRAILPELVPKEDLPAASALNGIEFNLARAAGPALAGVLVAAAGAGATFLVNTLSFLGVMLVIVRWKRPVRKRSGPAESLSGATAAAVRYVRHSPALLSLMFRSGTAMFFASALLALLPTVARSVDDSAVGYGALLGCFGVGAVLGALLMSPARARWSTNTVVSAGVAIVAMATFATGALHSLVALGAVMLVGGAGWLAFISLINAVVQGLAPDWVRARVLAVFMLISQGGMAAGSALWGTLAQRTSVQSTLLWAGVGTLAAAALGLVSRLPETSQDVSPWNHWRVPLLINGASPAMDDGPVLVTAEYIVKHGMDGEFLDAMHEYGRVRRRDGASQWGIFRDTEAADRYVETFMVDSWGEHLRQHDRQTQADRVVEEGVMRYVTAAPEVRHLLYARAED